MKPSKGHCLAPALDSTRSIFLGWLFRFSFAWVKDNHMRWVESMTAESGKTELSFIRYFVHGNVLFKIFLPKRSASIFIDQHMKVINEGLARVR